MKSSMKINVIFIIGTITLLLTSSFGIIISVKAEEYVNGIDVSHYQGSINWNQVYNAGYRFAFCKASQGISFKDSTFSTNMNQGANAGLYLGPYHYATPNSYAATAEASHFVSVIQPYMVEGYLRPVIDLEEGSNLGKTALTNWVIDFMTYVEEHTGIEPIIYCNSYYASSLLDSRVTQYDLWIAHWNAVSPNTGVWDTWSFWQYRVSSAGYVPGISGQCDLDYFNGNLNNLYQNFVIKSTPDDKIEFNGHEYQLFLDSQTWANAKANCEAMGGYLVTINSNEENSFVNNLIGANSIWIGLSDELDEGVWQWVTGESVSFTNWRSGEPNDYGSGEDYAEMYTDGTWNDIGPPAFPSITRYYVCEWAKEDDKIEYNGHEYKLITEAKSWSDAKIDCEIQGGHLVTITSQGENDFVKNLADSNRIWLGLTDEANEGNWKWITDEALSYTNWYPGEPNDYSIGEDYVEMYTDGRWNDIGPPAFPSITRHYVCEWEKSYSYNIFSTEGALGYAEYWWNKRNSHYADYSNVGGDCANFVSQCLIAGGLTLWKGSNGNGGGLDSRGCLPSCDNLHSHLSNFQSISYQRCVKSGSWDNELPSWVSPGTVLIYGTAGGDEWRHTVVVTGGNGDAAAVSGHTSDEYGWSWTAFSAFSVVHVYKPNGYTSTYCVVEITASNLNVRTGPSTSYNIVTTVQSGEKYVSLESHNGWYRIWLDDRSAWISGNYLTTHDISKFNCYKVTANTLNVRYGASTNYGIVGRCNYGQCFVQYGTNGDWCQIYYSSGTYWVHSDYLDLMEAKNIINYSILDSMPLQIFITFITIGIIVIGSLSYYLIKRRR